MNTKTAKRQKTGGRTRGTPNKLSASIKSAIESAFDKVGGEAYLVDVAKSDPRTFCGLLGKILPSQIDVGISEVDSMFDELFASLNGKDHGPECVQSDGETAGFSKVDRNRQAGR